MGVMRLDNLFSNYFEVRREMLEAVCELDQAQLDWQCPQHPNTIGGLLRHIAEIECWWTHCVALGRACSDSIESEFKRATTLPEILELLHRYHEEFAGFLRTHETQDWDRRRYTIERTGESIGMRWLVWHVVEHQARHRGRFSCLCACRESRPPMSKSRKGGKRILLTNDDGYFSSGITALYDELHKDFDVYMVAPDREQSASSHSLTLSHPLRVHEIDKRRFAIDGTPTDCVMLAIHLLFKNRRPDMIISGINHGANMGDDVTYSGTVAAAIEGSILKIPSMAVSMANWEPGTPMKRAARFVARLLAKHDRMNLESSTFLNVNLPVDNGKAYRKFEFTRLGSRQYKDTVVQKKDPRGKAYYWIGGRPTWRTTEGSDFAVVSEGKASITPLSMDFTDAMSLEDLKQLDLKL